MEFWKKNPVIYEINTWVWLDTLSREYNEPITLSNVPEEKWAELALLEIDAVWFMGVWERSPRGIAISNQHEGNLMDFRRALPDFTFEDNTGSPYCIRRYVVDEHLGGQHGLSEARRQLSQRGIKLILDFVPNHVAHDHPWVSSYPDYFIQGNKEDLRDDPVTYVQIGGTVFACGKDPYYPAWQDVLQLNVFHAALRAEIIGTLKNIANHCDGVRCDMAMLVMNEIFDKTWYKRAGTLPMIDYWEEVIPAIKRVNRNFIFIAEAYWEKEYALQKQGFDYCYDKRLYDRLEHEDVQSVRMHLTADNNYQGKLIRFIENHDEPRHTTVFPGDKLQAAAVIAATLPGAKLFHEGQFEGRSTKLPVFLRRRPDEPVREDVQIFYHRLLPVIHHSVFHRGYWQMCESTGWPDNDSYHNLLAWCWCDGDSRFLITVNYSDTPSMGRIRLPGHDLRGSNWRLNDVLCEVTYERNGDEMHSAGLFVALGAWKFHFFRFFMV
jgi:hypothetical protein